MNDDVWCHRGAAETVMQRARKVDVTRVRIHAVSQRLCCVSPGDHVDTTPPLCRWGHIMRLAPNWKQMIRVCAVDVESCAMYLL